MMIKGGIVLKKILIINGIIFIAILIGSLLLAGITDYLLTDLLFVGAMITLAIAASYLVIARRNIKKSVKNKSKEEKNKYRHSFHETEAQAFVLSAVSLLLFIISFLSVKP